MKSKKLLLISIGVLILIVGALFLIVGSQGPTTPFTLEEISKHATKEDCWTTIGGKVYDVTKFISGHKGGDKILNACGKDATDLFTGKSPMGRAHSRTAVKLLSKMQIGTLQE